MTRDSVVAFVSVALLVGAAVDRLSVLAPADAAPYHQRIREQVALAPLRVGAWVGQDVAVPTAAVKMLRPNVILSRRFTNPSNHAAATFLMVQCEDARDLLNHYPPVCYVAQGWRQVSAVPRDWAVDGRVIHGMEYEFVQSTLTRISSIHVSNFMLMADGRTHRDMDGIRTVAADLKRRFFGAGQVQLVVDGMVNSQQRDEMFSELIAAHRPLIDAVLSGEPQ